MPEPRKIRRIRRKRRSSFGKVSDNEDNEEQQNIVDNINNIIHLCERCGEDECRETCENFLGQLREEVGQNEGVITKLARWRPKEENPIDPPPGGYANYMSYQKIINSNNEQIDENLLEEHIEFMYESRVGWEEVPVYFNDLKPGDRIRYTTMSPKGKYLFRTGGWITHIDETGEWLSYMAHTKSTWCLQAEDCQRLFVIRKKIKTKKSIIKFKRPGPETNYNSYLYDSEGILQRVNSARDNWSKNRFESTNKFKNANNGHLWIFVD